MNLKKSQVYQSVNKALYIYLDNSADAWRQELMELAQQVKSSLTSADEHEQHYRLSRTTHLNKIQPKRSSSSTSNYNQEENNEQNVSKRLLRKRSSLCHKRSQVTKSKITNEKTEQEPSTNDENQDPGIWVKFFFFKFHFKKIFI